MHESNERVSISFIGPSGAGKGTQIELLAQHYEPIPCHTVSSGALLRAYFTQQGFDIETHYKPPTASLEDLAMFEEHIAGKFATDAQLEPLIHQYCDTFYPQVKGQHILFLDGVWRRSSQVQRFGIDIAKKYGITQKIVIFLDADNQLCLQRAHKRNRPDYNEEFIKTTLQEFALNKGSILEQCETHNIPIIYIQDRGESQKEISKTILSKIKRMKIPPLASLSAASYEV
ncbi:MAG: AAA family ATPase [Candidatus Woesearchaeota archaeon]